MYNMKIISLETPFTYELDRMLCVRVRCDRDSRAQVYLLLILKTLGKLGKNVWRSLAMQGLDPNRISTYVLGLLVLNNKGGVFLRGI